jgi:uncharacterized protein YecE (DUF72 family)
MIYIGTSGFSYDDWKGYFYPERLNKKDMLSYYSDVFNCVEINSSYYTIPGRTSFYGMARKTPPDFRFVVKAHKDMTHGETLQAEPFEQFVGSIEPLRDFQKLGCVLAQFPWSFKPTEENRDHLRFFREKMLDLPTVIEFRNADWITDETFKLLRELNFGFCCVDEPRLKGLIPPVAEATSTVGYIRFHGRNAKHWWKHEQAWQRYDYLYGEEELREWTPKIDLVASKTDTTYLFFNNHYRGKSAQNARMLAGMLGLPLGQPEPESQLKLE